MSMPSFPDSGIDLTRDQVLNMLLGSIAMEELALSHIMNAEGEKLQYLLGTLPGGPVACTTPEELLRVNHSVMELLEHINQSQILLRGKLSQVLEAIESDKESCPGKYPQIACILTAKKDAHWCKENCLIWKPAYCANESRCWDPKTPALIRLPRFRPATIHYNFQVQACEAGRISFCLCKMNAHCCEEVLQCDAYACTAHETVSLSGSVVIDQADCNESFFFLLRKPCSLTVKQASVTLAQSNRIK